MSNYTEGQVHQLMGAFEKEGATAQDLTKLGQSHVLIKNTLQLIRGNIDITVVKHTVDLGASPRLPLDGVEEIKHEGEGVVSIELRDDNLYVGGGKVQLFLSEKQKGDKRISGHELRKELEYSGQVLLNPNVLDYICDGHPELYPEHWKVVDDGITLHIFCWGSVFRNPSYGDMYVRCFYWGDGVLCRDYYWLGGDWERQDPSASVAS